MKRLSLVIVFLVASFAHAAKVPFVATLSSFTSAPNRSYLKVTFVNKFACIPVGGGAGAADKEVKLFPATGTNTITTQIVPNSDYSCAGVGNSTSYMIEVFKLSDVANKPDERLYGGETIIGAGGFDMATAQWIPPAPPATSTLSYAIRNGNNAFTGTQDFTGATVTGLAGASTPDATTLAKGKVQLAGDLGGTAAAPTVPALANKVDTTRTVNGHALSADVVVTKSDVGLGNADNTADAAKNVATAVTLAAGADRTKLDGIAAGAEVNVNADWNAVSGDAQILNKPTLPANTNAVSHQFFTGYNSTTGNFTRAQPDYSDLTGVPQLAVAKTCTGTDKVSAYNATTGVFTCTADQTGAAGGGITTLNGLTTDPQTFAKVDDTNMTLGISSVGSTHTFSLTWANLLGLARGGTNANLAATGGPGNVLKQTSVGGAVTVAKLATTELNDFNATPCATNGQVPIWNTSTSKYDCSDPIVSGAQPAATAQNVTTTGAQASVSVAGYGMALFAIRGTYGGFNATFEASIDGTNWWTIQASRLDSATVETTTGALTNTSRIWMIPAFGMTHVRWSVSAITSGTANLAITPMYAPQTQYVNAQVTNFPATQQVQSNSANLATESTLSTLNSKIPASPATDRATAAAPASVRLSDGAAFYKGTTPSDTQPISAASLPLPSGAAQEHTAAATPSATRLSDGAAFYKPTTPSDTQPISAASLPLPSGAAQEHTAAATPSSVRVSDGAAFIDPRDVSDRAGRSLGIVASITNALPAGTNLLGKAGFDNTTPGTTNGVTNYQPARTTGTLTSTTCPGTGCVSVATTGYGVATVTINGTYSLTPLPEFSDDGGTSWYGTTCTQTDSSAQATTFGALVNTSRAWDCSVYAASNFRIRASAFTSGTANIGITLSSAPIEVAPTVALATGSAVSANQGTPAAAANRWPVSVSDGTNSMPTMDAAARKGFVAVTDGTNTAAVKAASTAAAASDPSAVVAFSPNSPLPAGSNVAGKFGIDQTTPGTTNAVQAIPGTSGGASTSYLPSAATTNATSVKASAGQVYTISAINTTATLYYLRMYNLAAAPTCSSATGFVETIPIPASTSGGGVVRDVSVGQAYGTGIAFCLTGGGSSTDNTSAATGVYLTVLYK